jgi:glyoxylase-like metal-dependent hydrolase (beta-lactamase superfamily II)
MRMQEKRISVRSSRTSIVGRKPQLTKQVAPGVHRLAHAYVNCYLIEDGSAVTIVDTAFPATWPYLLLALQEIGRRPADVEAVLLTHAHFDHLGFAARAAAELSVPIWVHPEDQFIAAHPYRYQHERSRLLYPLLYPRGVPVLGAMAAASALRVEGLASARDMSPGRLEVPGRPMVIFTPGHTWGHCVLHLPERDTLITGDALVTLDPYKAARGAQVIAGAATANSDMALSSLEAIAQTGARVLLPGHGEPWRQGAAAAVAAALAVGAS